MSLEDSGRRVPSYRPLNTEAANSIVRPTLDHLVETVIANIRIRVAFGRPLPIKAGGR